MEWLSQEHPDVFASAIESGKITPGMTEEDFTSAMKTLNLEDTSDVLSEMDLSKSDFPELIQLLFPPDSPNKQVVERRFGGNVKGKGGWRGKRVPGMKYNK